ncbi:MAG: glycosyltransferase family 4 protein, partial [Gammaproteobacteria bacterium]
TAFAAPSCVSGTGFRQHMMRTRTSNWVFGLASDHTIGARDELDMVVQIGVNHLPFARKKRPGVVYTAITDHTNLLSKQLPDFGLHFPERFVSSTWNALERLNLLRQDHIFVLGSHVKRSMVEDYGIPEQRITVVGSGPNLDVDIERDDVAKDERGKNVLFVGLEPERKGLPALKKAFAKVLEAHPDAVLHVVGVEAENETGIVHYGEVRGEALKQRFYQAQIFAMPSLREPFGVVFVEAMWAKAVCVGTNIGAIPELIDDGETGFVVEPNDSDALAARIIALFDQPEMMKGFAERAYAQAKQKWSWEHVLTKILADANHLLKKTVSS